MPFRPPFRRRPRGRAAPPPSEAETLVRGRPAADAPPVVEEEEGPAPPRRPRPPLLWPWLLLLLLLVLGGLVVGYLLSRDDDNSSTTTGAAARVNVPNVVGLRQRAAVAKLRGAKLDVTSTGGRSNLPRGVVFAQRPAAGERVRRDTVVVISVSRVATVKVPNVTGLQSRAAVVRLRAAHLEAQVLQVVSTLPAGTVARQTPKVGASVAQGSEVTLAVSRGTVSVPEVVGNTRIGAVAKLNAAGLQVVVREVPSEEPSGTVTAQQPLGGAKVARGTRVRVNVSTGPAAGTTPTTTTTTSGKASVPRLVGLAQTPAQRQLINRGLRATVVYVASSKPQGQVVTQSPAPGTSVSRGSRVRLNVSMGPDAGALKRLPDVVGQDRDTAGSTLSDAGFTVVIMEIATSDPSQEGIVIDEEPDAGSRVPVGAQVTLYVGRAGG